MSQNDLSPCRRRTRGLALFLAACLSLLPLAATWAGKPEAEGDEEKSVFLVATDQLDGTSFEQTVIFMVHFGGRGGTTGLAINRPTDIPLSEAFPNIPRQAGSDDVLYLGGPVSTQSIFVLLRTPSPKKGMMHLVKDIYFVPGHHVLGVEIEGESRAYAGYTGWAPGQLQAEIDRGDWQVVREDPALVFEKDTSKLWLQLSRQWSGSWI